MPKSTTGITLHHSVFYNRHKNNPLFKGLFQLQPDGAVVRAEHVV